MDWKRLFLENWKIITGIVILLAFLFLIIFIISSEGEVRKKREEERGLLICPIRGVLRVKKYDADGNYSEEYQRIRLITYFLKKGYPKSVFRLEYPLEKSFGHQGRSKVKILVDLVLKKEGQIWVVAEVKKGYHPEKKKSAIEHQLKPAMAWTGSKYGIYWDGSNKSCLLSRNTDGTLSVQEFP